ncbi:MAG: hypothetical protein ACPL6C_00110 [bacterium]
MIGRAFFFLFFSFLFGFKPGPRPGLPRFLFDKNVNVRFISFSGKSVVENGTARVSFSAMFSIYGDSLQLYPVSSFIRADSLELFINGEKYDYVPSGRDIFMLPYGYLFLQMNYRISTSYAFSGPPGEWIYGECFELLSPLQRNTPIEPNIKPEQLAFVVVVPKDFESMIPKFGWEKKEEAERIIFFTSNPDILDWSNYWYIQRRR